MTDQQRTIDLIIQAQLKGGRDLKSITQSIADLEKALEQQAEAAKKGEGSIKDLQAASAALKAVQDELGGRQTAIKNFEGLSKAIERQSQAVTEAQARLKNYEASLDSDVTTKQQDRVQKLTAAYERSAVKLVTLRQDFANVGNALAQAGVNTGNIAQELDAIGAASLRGATAIRQANDQTRDFFETVRKAKDAQAELGAAQRRAADDAEAFARGERLAAEAASRRAKAEQEVQELLANRRGQGAAEGRLNQEQAEAQARQQALAALRKDIEDRSRLDALRAEDQASLAKQNAALRKTADEAEKAARGYTGLARAASDLTPRTQSLRDALSAITSPAETARASLAGVEKEISDLADSIAQNNGRVDDYRQTLAQLGAAQRSLSTQGNLIDTFNRQLALLRNSRTELVAARDQVNQYAAAVRQGGDAGEQFVRPLAEAEARLKRAAAAVRDQTVAAREARQALRDAGINTQNLSEAQQRLVTSAQRATQATKQLAAAQANTAQGGAAPRGQTALGLFNDEGRTTLSLAQRIRGEILALSAGFVGLYGVIDLARKSLNAYKESQSLSSALGFALGGSTAQTAEEIAYLRSEADRLGLAFGETSKQYARFAAGAVRSGASIQETRFIFESFSEAGTVLGFRGDELGGILNALAQSFSKGKIQAEELRQQIGERLPGAFAFAQEALRDKFPDLNKALEQGQVGAENLVIIAESVRRAAADQLGPALVGLNAEQNRFNNSVLDFQKLIANSGFADAFTNLLKDLRDLMDSGQGQEFAQNIGKAFAVITNGAGAAIKFIVEISDSFDTLLKVGLAYAGISLFGNIIGSVGAVVTALTAIRTATLSAAGAAVVLQNAFVFLRILAIAVGIGAILLQQRDQIAQFTDFLTLKFKIAFIAVDEYFTSFVLRMVADFRAATNEIIKLLNRLPLVNIDLLDASPERLQGQLKALSTWADRERAKAQAAFDFSLPARAPTRGPGSTRVRTGTELPATRPNSLKPDDKTGERELKKRESEIEALNKQLDSLDAKLDRAQGDNLARQLEAIDTQYRDIAKRIASVGGKEAILLGNRWGTLYAEARNAATEKFNDTRAKAEESLQARIEQIESQAGRRQKNDLESRREAVRKSNADLFRDIEARRQVRLANGLDTSRLDTLKGELELAQASLITAAEQKKFAEDLAASEKRINDLLTVRKERIDEIRQLETEGKITDVEAQDRIRRLVAETQPGIDAIAASSVAFGESLRGAVDNATLDAFIAKIDAARNSGARLTAEFDQTGRTIRDGFLKSLDTGIGAAVDSLGELATRTQSVGGAFRTMGRAVLQVMNDVVKQLIAAAIRTAILRAIANGGQPTSSVGFGIPSGVELHSGGVVGSGGRRRAVDPTWFANAPRYHAGGIVGLRPDEYPAILQRNEEVLSKSDPRNVMNNGMRPAAQSGGGSVRVVLVDDPKRAAEQLAGQDGERVVIQHIRSNLPTLRQMLR